VQEHVGFVHDDGLELGGGFLVVLNSASTKASSMVYPLPRAAAPVSVDLALRADSTVVLVRPVFLAIAAAETPIRDSWW
jgi:hypothetical protein